jgi:hypothetical protein
MNEHELFLWITGSLFVVFIITMMLSTWFEKSVNKLCNEELKDMDNDPTMEFKTVGDFHEYIHRNGNDPHRADRLLELLTHYSDGECCLILYHNPVDKTWYWKAHRLATVPVNTWIYGLVDYQSGFRRNAIKRERKITKYLEKMR